MQVDKSAAEIVLRRASSEAAVSAASPEWKADVAKLADLCEDAGTRTHLAIVVTSMLAKATDERVDLIAFKPNHAGNNKRAYSARTLCHKVVVPLAAEIGFSIGVTGGEPLNNQPYFRMERLDDGTPVSSAGTKPFEFALKIIRKLNRATSTEASRALSAFVAVMRERVVRYDKATSGASITLGALIRAIDTLVKEGSEGGRRAQAIVAGMLDVFAGTDRVLSGRINDPSRNYPGDVLLAGVASGDVSRAFEVRDKPVSISDLQVFARKCLTLGVRDAACVAVSSSQTPLDLASLDSWCEQQGMHMTVYTSWRDFVHEVLFWGGQTASVAASSAVEAIHNRLIGVEASPAAVRRWSELASNVSI